MRTGQSRKAVPYLEAFIKSPVDDATLVELRDRYGAGSFLRLADEPETRRYVQPLVERLMTAARRDATQPERISRWATELTGTEEEQSYAVDRLREAGPFAVPLLIQALQNPALTAQQRSLMARNLGRLDQSAVPPLLAVLDSPDATLAADAATAVGAIGDPRAVPFLTYFAAATRAPAPVRGAARSAVASLTGRPFADQPRSPAQVLLDAAWSYHRHQIEFPGDSLAVWVWDPDRKVPAPWPMNRAEAERYLALRLAQQAVLLEPQKLDARTCLTSLKLQEAIARVGLGGLGTQDNGALAAAIAAGPSVLTEVLRKAIGDGKDGLAAASATALGRVTRPEQLSGSAGPHPLVEALSAPGAHAKFAAARALVELAPRRPFPGSSHVVPTLARFAIAQRPPKAVIIDPNPTRGGQLAGAFMGLGYEPILELKAVKGFQAAAESADVEVVAMSPVQAHGGWDLIDILTNLKHDSRTRALPVYIYGPLSNERDRARLAVHFPGVKFVVQPADSAILESQIGGRPARLSPQDRAVYALGASALLARIAAQPASPFAADLNAVEPELTVALNQPDTSLAAALALGDVPHPDAQRSLAAVVLDPSQPAELRRGTVSQLAHSIRRFGAR